MNSVLIVDDEATFLLSLTDGLKVHEDKFEAITAANGQEAVDILESKDIDLLVTDIKMPVMDGIELMAYVSRSHTELPVFVMTAFATPKLEEMAQGLGCIQFLEKPIDLDDLAEKILEELGNDSIGHMSGISLPSFIQLLWMEGSTYTLSITSRGRSGQLFFRKGELLDAETEDINGLEAAHEIISWDEIAIDIYGKCPRMKNKINRPVDHIIMESVRLLDERRLQEEEATAPGGDDSLEGEKVCGDDDAPAPDVEMVLRGLSCTKLQKKLEEFSSLNGFNGVAMMLSTGETLSVVIDEDIHIFESISMAVETLSVAGEMSNSLGMGDSALTGLQTEKGYTLILRVETSDDDATAQSYLCLVLDRSGEVVMAKQRMENYADFVAEMINK